jgi:hypothetical protein
VRAQAWAIAERKPTFRLFRDRCERRPARELFLELLSKGTPRSEKKRFDCRE